MLFISLSTKAQRFFRYVQGEGTLKEFLEKHRAEAREMSIFEYDQEKHLRQEREAAWEDGHAAGVKDGRAAGVKEGHAAGLLDGAKEAAKKAAKKLFKLGLPLDTIADTVDADIEEVQAWLAEENGESRRE